MKKWLFSLKYWILKNKKPDKKQIIEKFKLLKLKNVRILIIKFKDERIILLFRIEWFQYLSFKSIKISLNLKYISARIEIIIGRTKREIKIKEKPFIK